MKLVRFKEDGSIKEEILAAGDHYIDAALTDVVLFIRPDHLLPLSKGGQFIEEVDFENLEYISYVKEKATYEYYHDDGFSKDYDNPKNINVITVER